ncbi:MAG: hypothetical protein SFW35_05930 [Chitinophagales bacterium]|nr:hypothetical protein [Chitinophagales bacterium]
MRVTGKIIILLLLLFCFGLGLMAQDNGPIHYSPLKKLIPSGTIPKGVKISRSNNNMDLIKFEGRYYMAFRTAPHHFPNKRVRMYILSSNDMQNWQLEQEIFMGSDLREPRFLNFQDKLFLYFFQGGGSPFKFDPQHVWACARDSAQSWSTHQLANLDGFVPWRVKVFNGKAYLSAYFGKGLYTSGHKADLRLFSSVDGRNWQPIHQNPQVAMHGAEEGEFEFDCSGNLWATVRLEGKGAYIAYADKDSLYNWQLFPCNDKYDSALMFTHDDDIYLISRRNHDGSNFAKAPKWMPYALAQKFNLVSYSFSKKVTALFKLDKNQKLLTHVLDFPSTGDNSFPAIVGISDSSYIMLNYSSDIEGRKKTWFIGQLGKTYIYLTEIMFNKNKSFGMPSERNRQKKEH